MKTAGMLIVILGLVMTLHTSFPKDTTERVVHMGPLRITEENESTVHWQPYVAIALMVGGIYSHYDRPQRLVPGM